MDSLELALIAGAAVAGALAGAAGCYWRLSRHIAALRERGDRAEQARNGALERSAQARAQIAQLNHAIAELRKSHSLRGVSSGAGSTAEERRAAAEKALADARPDEKTLVLTQPQPLKAFADTEMLDDKH